MRETVKSTEGLVFTIYSPLHVQSHEAGNATPFFNRGQVSPRSVTKSGRARTRAWVSCVLFGPGSDIADPSFSPIAALGPSLNLSPCTPAQVPYHLEQG